MPRVISESFFKQHGCREQDQKVQPADHHAPQKFSRFFHFPQDKPSQEARDYVNRNHAKVDHVFSDIKFIKQCRKKQQDQPCDDIHGKQHLYDQKYCF